VVQVLSNLAVTVSTSSNVEITLHLVEIKTAVDTAAVRRTLDLWCLGPFRPLLSSPHNVVNVLLSKTLILVSKVLPPSTSADLSILIPSEFVHSLLVHPLVPVGALPSQLVGGEDAIAGSVLDVDVQISALHTDDDVEVDLHLVGDALFDGKVVCFVAAPPPGDFGPEEDDGDDGHCDCPLAAAGGAGDVFRFRLR
jgi:hypothetical protein